MYNPTMRLLTILELLQSREKISGKELAQRLEVDNRSVRRYMAMLQDLGIPVESSRGRYGTYSLRPGFKLPPLMLTEEEALAVALGLLIIQSKGLAFATPSVVGASAKIARVLPANLRERIQVLQQVVVLVPHIHYEAIMTSGELILQVSEAVYKQQQLWLSYRSAQNEHTKRVVDPYGIAYWAGRWYMVGYCHLRQGMRAYRLDRVTQAEIQPTSFEAPADFDCREYVLSSFGNAQPMWELEILFEPNLPEGSKSILQAYGSLEEQPDGFCYRSRVDSLDDTARFLIDFRCKFVVINPPELRQALRQLAQEISQLAELNKSEKFVPVS